MKNKLNKYILVGRTFENLELYDKPLWVFLKSTFLGLGQSLSKKISIDVGLSLTNSLSFYKFRQQDLIKIIKKIDNIIKDNNIIIGRTLLRQQQIKFDFEIKRGSYKGFCYNHSLPVRNQRTHTNANSVKRMFKDRSGAITKVKNILK
jgi:ribosomal protein S13